jgi:hypothetical protein
LVELVDVEVPGGGTGLSHGICIVRREWHRFGGVRHQHLPVDLNGADFIAWESVTCRGEEELRVTVALLDGTNFPALLPVVRTLTQDELEPIAAPFAQATFFLRQQPFFFKHVKE